MVKKTEVRTYINRLYCDKCGTEMETSPVVLTTYPPQYQYKCPKCGECTVSTNSYPYIEYENL